MAQEQRNAKKTHALLAVAFLFVVLVEWGSHNLAFAHAEPTTGLVAVTNVDGEHVDLCRTIACCEGRKHEQLAPNSAHEIPNYAPVVERSGERLLFDRLRKEPPLIRGDACGIFRPTNPLLHPPEFS